MPASKKVKRFWKKRFTLFQKYDSGVMLDDESWYSVTPEPVARHIAKRVKMAYPSGASVLDSFSGCGGNLIQFAIYN